MVLRQLLSIFDRHNIERRKNIPGLKLEAIIIVFWEVMVNFRSKLQEFTEGQGDRSEDVIFEKNTQPA